MCHHHHHRAVINWTATARRLCVVRNVWTPDQPVVVTAGGIHGPRTLEPQLSTGTVSLSSTRQQQMYKKFCKTITKFNRNFNMNRLHCAYQEVRTNYSLGLLRPPNSIFNQLAASKKDWLTHGLDR